MKADDIQNEHERLGYTAGWRFLTAPQRNLATARTAIVTLNPGGERDLETTMDERWSTEAGSAYRIESWRGRPAGAAPLQRQVQQLCRLLNENSDAVLSGHFVPFRSKNWDSLPRSEEAALFGLKLWRWVLSISPAQLIVCIGKRAVGDGVAGACGARPIGAMPSGWGDLTIDRYLAVDGRRVIALPHLSRFGLFGDPGRESLFLKALDLGAEGEKTPAPVANPPQGNSPPSEAAPAPVPAGRGPLLKRGAKRPSAGTVWAMVYDRVPLSGIARGDLVTALAAVPYVELPPKVRSEPSVQQPGSLRWWNGYVGGCLRRHFLTGA